MGCSLFLTHPSLNLHGSGFFQFLPRQIHRSGFKDGLHQPFPFSENDKGDLSHIADGVYRSVHGDVPAFIVPGEDV